MGVQINGSEGNVIATKGTYSGNVTIGGTLTYEDVTNIDSVGLVTARTGIEIGARPGVAASISIDGNMIVSGISTFGGDVQVPDKIIHSGDTDTAIRFPSADTITAETGGSERIRIDSSGRLLLGTTTEGQADADNLTIADSGSCGITIRSGTSAAGTIYFSDATSGAAEYDGAVIYNQSSQYMDFYTAQSQRLRINSSGSVGIATQSVSSARLDVIDGIINVQANDTSKDSRVQFTRKDSGIFSWVGIPTWNSNAFYIYGPKDSDPYNEIAAHYESEDWKFYTDGTERLNIDSSGYVTKPSQFHILVRRASNQTGYNPSQGFGTGIIYNEVVTTQGTDSSVLDTSNGRITVPVAGIYFLEGSGYSSTAAFTQGWFTKNGSRLAYSDWMNNSGLSQNFNASGFHKLAANDTIGFKAYGSQHTSVTVEASIYHTWMRITLVG